MEGVIFHIIQLFALGVICVKSETIPTVWIFFNAERLASDIAFDLILWHKRSVNTVLNAYSLYDSGDFCVSMLYGTCNA